MDNVRNFINVVGISPIDEILKETKGKLIRTSQTENIAINKYSSDIKNIYQIIIDLEIKNQKVICAYTKKIIVLDCSKKIKIIYYDNDNGANILELTLPYNTSIELNKEEEVNNIDIHVGDAYFELINNETLYNYILYFVNVDSSNKKLDKDKTLKSNKKHLFKKDKEFTEPCNEIIGIENKKCIFKKLVNEEDENYALKEISVARDCSNNVEFDYSCNETLDIDEEYL